MCLALPHVCENGRCPRRDALVHSREDAADAQAAASEDRGSPATLGGMPALGGGGLRQRLRDSEEAGCPPRTLLGNFC